MTSFKCVLIRSYILYEKQKFTPLFLGSVNPIRYTSVCVVQILNYTILCWTLKASRTWGVYMCAFDICALKVGESNIFACIIFAYNPDRLPTTRTNCVAIVIMIEHIGLCDFVVRLC